MAAFRILTILLVINYIFPALVQSWPNSHDSVQSGDFFDVTNHHYRIFKNQLGKLVVSVESSNTDIFNQRIYERTPIYSQRYEQVLSGTQIDKMTTTQLGTIRDWLSEIARFPNMETSTLECKFRHILSTFEENAQGPSKSNSSSNGYNSSMIFTCTYRIPLVRLPLKNDKATENLNL